MRIIFLITLLFFCENSLPAQASGQRNLQIHLQPRLSDQVLHLGEEQSVEGQRITINTFKFYLSNFSLSKSGKVIWKEKDSYHLVDASDLQSLQLGLVIPDEIEFDRLQFNVGIDSTTNISGAFGGDLDPTKGMYWAWNSGYINFKLEGTSPNCPGRKNEFQFHLGGYLSPFETVQNVQLKVQSNNDLNIKIDLSKLLNQVDLSKQYKIMSPGAEAKKLSEIVATIFYIDDKK